MTTPIIEIVSDEVNEAATIPIFSLDGVLYSIPKDIPAGIGIEGMEIATEKGESFATIWLAKRLLGEDGYNTIKTNKAVTFDHFARIMDRIGEYVFGQMEKSRGK